MTSGCCRVNTQPLCKVCLARPVIAWPFREPTVHIVLYKRSLSDITNGHYGVVGGDLGKWGIALWVRDQIRIKVTSRRRRVLTIEGDVHYEGGFARNM